LTAKFRDVYLPTLKANFVLWPAVQILNFRVIPIQFQIVSCSAPVSAFRTNRRVSHLFHPLVSPGPHTFRSPTPPRRFEYDRLGERCDNDPYIPLSSTSVDFPFRRSGCFGLSGFVYRSIDSRTGRTGCIKKVLFCALSWSFGGALLVYCNHLGCSFPSLGSLRLFLLFFLLIQALGSFTSITRSPSVAAMDTFSRTNRVPLAQRSPQNSPTPRLSSTPVRPAYSASTGSSDISPASARSMSPKHVGLLRNYVPSLT